MARIADKHGLTNQYRDASIGKRVVKRGRPSKSLFGSSGGRKRTSFLPKAKRTSKYSHSHDEPDFEITSWTVLHGAKQVKVNSCQVCNGIHVEKNGGVYVCQNCRATYTSLEQLKSNNDLSRTNKSRRKKSGCLFPVLIIFIGVLILVLYNMF